MALAGLLVIGLICLIVGIVVFYAEEDWRGKRAWKNYKHKLEARGASLDWAAYIPAPVPDEQNIFEAPRMEEWFVGGSANGLTSKLNAARFLDFLQQSNINTVAELTVVPSNAKVAAGDADIVLQYDPPYLNIAEMSAAPSKTSDPHFAIIPLIVMDEVPLRDAIKNLARVGGLNYMLDPEIPWGQPSPNGKPAPQPYVSLRWTNLTPQQALLALLRNYNLQLIENPGPVARIVNAPPSLKVIADAAVSQQMTKLIQAALGSGTNGSREPAAIGSLYLALFDRPLPKVKPLRIFVRAEKVPTDAEITEFFPTNAIASITTIAQPLRATLLDDNSFRLTLNPESYTSAADYLAWSDQFQSDFEIMGEALKRPYARMDGDYQQPFDIPHPNFNTVRMVTQTLSQRAQCFLLLGQPDEALRELTLLHDLCRLVNPRPSTLTSTMFDVALTGIYSRVVADGLRLHAWHEPQLSKLQQQLQEIDLLPSLVNALELERAKWCRFFETATPAQCETRFSQCTYPPGPISTNLLQQLQDPVYLLFTFAPRDWIYRNMLCMADSDQRILDCFDLKNHVVLPQKMTNTNREIQTAFAHPTPFTLLASRAFVNPTHASSTLAQNQTLAREALIACALERYHLVHNCYPETLNALAPQFLDKIPSDIIGGQPLKYRAEKTQFALYSIGWNEKDDGGVASLRNDGSPNPETADWVWPNREKSHR